MPLFEQILITCLKCSRASFSPSSYSEKMRWERGWAFRSTFFEISRKLQWRNSVMESIFVTPQVSEVQTILGQFSGIPWTNNEYGSFKLFNGSFYFIYLYVYFFEAIYRLLVLCENLLLILKYYFKYVSFIKNKPLWKEV